MDDKKFKLIVRIGWDDAHYTGGLVAGGYLMELFGDAATVLMQKYDGDGGLLAAYESVEFLAPIYAGDVIEIEVKLINVGNTSRKFECIARKILQQMDMGPNPSSAVFFETPIIVGKAVGIGVVRKEKQWLHDPKQKEKYQK
jgi:3-aminobutyryl-CoA ammonia-lyase